MFFFLKKSYFFRVIVLYEFWSLKTCMKDEKFCNQDISKTITARDFKLGQLIEVDK